MNVTSDPPTSRRRTEEFAVVDDHLVRSVTPARGRPYEHRCSRDTFREVLWAGEDLACGGFTLEEIAGHANLPHTQVAVALAFLKERGCVETRHRRSYPADRCFYEDGMIEFWPWQRNRTSSRPNAHSQLSLDSGRGFLSATLLR
jgi:hypothetical protein